MKLNQVLDEIKQLNSSNDTEWQYVAYCLAPHNTHVLLIPLEGDQYSWEITVGVWTEDKRTVVTPDQIPQWVKDLLNWQIWKWLPNEERRIFKPAEETMISDSRTN